MEVDFPFIKNEPPIDLNADHLRNTEKTWTKWNDAIPVNERNKSAPLLPL
jgi:hypothetical protein